ncbi:MAG: hypothetical protein H6739_28900 [Alphaproteobacteria bacterium]|nr:hypothetical protein [Alphaproteobacteria bacterium]
MSVGARAWRVAVIQGGACVAVGSMALDAATFEVVALYTLSPFGGVDALRVSSRIYSPNHD